MFQGGTDIRKGGRNTMMGPMTYGPYGGMWFFHFLFWVLILIGIVPLIVWIVRQQGGGATGRREDETALDILKKRYARGEISSEEFEKMKKHIS